MTIQLIHQVAPHPQNMDSTGRTSSFRKGLREEQRRWEYRANTHPMIWKSSR
jgi:hypothetical protein